VRGALAAAAAATLLAACGRAPATTTDDASAAASASAPIDRTRPGELAEGAEDAFGLRLPRYFVSRARFPQALTFEGPAAPELVANYVRQRVVDGRIETGPAKTVFEGVHPKGAAAKTLHVEVVASRRGTQLYVRDETRPTSHDQLTPDERMRSVGLNPDGTLIDPTHLE
jgi:hypothetical protein